MEEIVTFYCPHCGNHLEAPSEMIGVEAVCPNCDKSIVVPKMAVSNPAELPQGRESVTIDLSDEKWSSLYRWLKIIRGVLYAYFAIEIFSGLHVSFSMMTLVASFFYSLAAAILVCGVGRGARWARISIYLMFILGVVLAVVNPREMGGGDWAGLVVLGLATAMLLLPSVSAKLKELERNSKPTWKVSLLFWGLYILSLVIVCMAPEAEGLVLPKGFPVIVLILPLGILAVVIEKFIGKINHAMGGTVADAMVISTKCRNVSCPNCGQFVDVPDTDDNDLVTCPLCQHMFYPFGRSNLAMLAFYLGLVSPLILPAPFALVCGILAIKDIKENRGKHGIMRAKVGVVIGGIITGVLCWPLALPIGIYFYFRKKKNQANRSENT